MYPSDIPSITVSSYANLSLRLQVHDQIRNQIIANLGICAAMLFKI